MQAIILAGGLGTRLMPLTQDLPKPMIPVLNKPLMEYSVDLLKKHGINEIGVTLMYLPQYIKNHFENGNKFDVKIKYFEEETPMGTAGSVKLAQSMISDTFIVLSGDALTNIDITKIHKYHKSKGADITIVLSKQENPLEYGVVLTDFENRITSFIEKPQWENVVSNTVNTGIYIIEKHILDKIPTDTPFDFSKDLFPMLLKEDCKMYGYITEDYWCDLGNKDDYLNANIDLLQGKVFGNKYENVLEQGVILSENTKLIPPVYIGKNTVITGDCKIGPNVIIGENNVLESTDIIDSLLWNRCVINNCSLNNQIIGENTKIEKTVFNGQNTVGSNVILNKNTVLKKGATIYNDVNVMPESVIAGDLKTSNTKEKYLFNDGIIEGLWNHQIKTEHLLGLASSYKNEKVFVCSNKTHTGTALANLLASFYSLCGSNVYVFNANIFACRFFASVNKIQGIYIFEDNEFLNIHLINEKGLNIPYTKEKNINFNAIDYSLLKGKIIRLNSVDSDFEYFLNTSFPFTKENIEVYSDNPIKLHNVINKNGEFKSLSNIAKAAVIVNNNVITDVYYNKQRISSVNFMHLKLDIAKLIGMKEVFMPPYAPDEIITEAENNNIKILFTQQHLGNSMLQADNFNNMAILLEYVPHFFAQAMLYFLQKQNFNNFDQTVIARYDFNIDPKKSLEAIFNLNKNKTTNHITANYKGGFITILPRNNGYSFTAYGRFAKEEYAPDILEDFIKENVKK